MKKLPWIRIASYGFFITLCVVGAFAILSSTMSKNPVLNPFAESRGTPKALKGLIATTHGIQLRAG